MKKTMIDILSAVGLLSMVAGILLLLWNDGLLSLSPIVIVVQVLAFFLMIWARATFGRHSFHATASPTEGGLVTAGPYRYVRHPIYAAVLFITWAGVLGNLSVLNVAFGLLTLAGSFARIGCEETLVRVRYPEYDEYAKKTRRLIPFVF
ncbi:MAG: isoprenylcysteine carboxylmethyltransferase family protein [Ignavibacteriales bacterium]|nr:isoprenylcysteine carboxylmethyltransferase family protein [Ignavibacteriales bacterium]